MLYRRRLQMSSQTGGQSDPFTYPMYWLNEETYEEAKQIYEYVTENFEPFTEGFYPSGTIQAEVEWDGTIYVYTITSFWNISADYIEFGFTGSYPPNTILISAIIDSYGTVYIEFEED